MVKVTLNENLVPSRHPSVKGNPHSDLIVNMVYARKLIRTAQFIFQLKRGAATFSGYIREHPVGPISLHLMEKGRVVRTLLLSELGYMGELCADVEDLREAVSQDVFEGLALKPAVHIGVCG